MWYHRCVSENLYPYILFDTIANLFDTIAKIPIVQLLVLAAWQFMETLLNPSVNIDRW